MRKLFLLLGCVIYLSFSFGVLAQNIIEHKLDDVVITAGRTAVSFSDLARNVQVIGSKEIKNIPVSSITELLKYTASVDVRQRGVEGVQADVSIRGGTFEQTLILIDGVKVNDSQTGHHNMDVPVSLENIERIEILKGQGSRIYGPDAFAGVINIITKQNSGSVADLHFSGGQNATYSGEATVSIPFAGINQSISVSKKKSNGYRHNTGYDIFNLNYKSSVNFSKGVASVFAGYNNKEFGANGFYTTAFPNQWEHTKTTFANLSGDFIFGSIAITAKTYWRKHDDEFLLKYDDPSFYKNTHETNAVGAELQASLESIAGTTSLGGELGGDKIESSNLGNHNRDKKGFFFEQKISPFQNFTIIAGAFAYDYAGIGWKYWPGLDVAFRVNDNTKIFASAGKAFRIPTFTDLYYVSPANMGNPELKYEETVNYELGITYVKQYFSAAASFFRKEGKNIIDWVKDNEADPWQVQNVAEVNTNGLELNFNFEISSLIKNIPVKNIQLSYTYIDADKNTGSALSKYTLGHLKHQLVLNLINDLPGGIKQSWAARFEERVNGDSNFIIDTRVSKKFNLFETYITVSNLFNKSQVDFIGVPLPGRWIKGGVKFRLFE